jgi:preflagellin peptidase FlaK
MHRYEEKDGNVKRIFRFNGSEVDDELYSSLMKWKREGKIGERVWITPKLPFLIPITLGFLTAVVYGDILMQIIAMFLRPR